MNNKYQNDSDVKQPKVFYEVTYKFVSHCVVCWALGEYLTGFYTNIMLQLWKRGTCIPSGEKIIVFFKIKQIAGENNTKTQRVKASGKFFKEKYCLS